MVSSYVSTLEAGDAYTAPSEGDMMVKEVTTEDPIEGATITVRKAGQSTDYQIKTTDAEGKVTAAICAEDENFDFFITATGYEPYFSLNHTAALLWAADLTRFLTPL